MENKKSAGVTALKIFLISFIISVGVSVIAELFLSDMGLIAAIIVVLALIALGIIFDIIGVAFTSCDQTPFISMSSRGIKKARYSLRLLKKAGIVSNVCNDVIGDICNIVSGAAGAAIVVKAFSEASSVGEFIGGIALSSIIASFTVAGKSLGKGIAIKNNVKIVEMTGSVLSLFERKKSHKKRKKQV